MKSHQNCLFSMLILDKYTNTCMYIHLYNLHDNDIPFGARCLFMTLKVVNSNEYLFSIHFASCNELIVIIHTGFKSDLVLFSGFTDANIYLHILPMDLLFVISTTNDEFLSNRTKKVVKFICLKICWGVFYVTFNTEQIWICPGPVQIWSYSKEPDVIWDEVFLRFDLHFYLWDQI